MSKTPDETTVRTHLIRITSILAIVMAGLTAMLWLPEAGQWNANIGLDRIYRFGAGVGVVFGWSAAHLLRAFGESVDDLRDLRRGENA